jgi:hypothetical protein
LEVGEEVGEERGVVVGVVGFGLIRGLRTLREGREPFGEHGLLLKDLMHLIC